MKNVLVTGASEGIGRSFAVKLAAKGYAVTAVARSEVRLRELVGELNGGGSGSQHTFIVADLTTTGGVALIAAALAAKKFDLLINNAGFATYGAFGDVSLSTVEQMTKLNCDCLMALSHFFLKTAVNGDALINISSTASFLPMPFSGVYCATKSFVTALSEALWFEQRKRGVYVLALCPGLTSTQFHTRAGGNNVPLPTLLSQTPDQVAERGLKALKYRCQPVVICGMQRYFLFLTKFLPRKWALLLAGHAVERGMAKYK